MSGVRGHDRHLPDRRDDARLPATDGPGGVARAARRCVREGPGPVPPAGDPDPVYSESIELDLGTVEPSLAGPRRPQDRVPLKHAKSRFPGGARDAAGGGEEDLAAPPSPAVAAMANEGGVAVLRPMSAAAARSRFGRHRRHHQLHEHVESERDDRRRTAREEGGRTRAHAPALGEDKPCPGLEGRHGVPAQGGPRAVPRPARVQPRRLRLHDVHRQQRAAARRGGGRGRGSRSGRRVGAERQPQLRGTHSAAGARQLSRVAAARGRLRTRGADDRRSHDRTARDGPRRHAGLSARHLADRARDSGDDADAVNAEMFREQYADVFAGDERWRSLAGAGRRSVRLGPRFDLHPQSAVLRWPDAAAGAAARTSPARGCSRSSATASRRITFRRPDPSRRTVRQEGT